VRRLRAQRRSTPGSAAPYPAPRHRSCGVRTPAPTPMISVCCDWLATISSMRGRSAARPVSMIERPANFDLRWRAAGWPAPATRSSDHALSTNDSRISATHMPRRQEVVWHQKLPRRHGNDRAHWLSIKSGGEPGPGRSPLTNWISRYGGRAAAAPTPPAQPPGSFRSQATARTARCAGESGRGGLLRSAGIQAVFVFHVKSFCVRPKTSAMRKEPVSVRCGRDSPTGGFCSHKLVRRHALADHRAPLQQVVR